MKRFISIRVRLVATFLVLSIITILVVQLTTFFVGEQSIKKISDDNGRESLETIRSYFENESKEALVIAENFAQERMITNALANNNESMMKRVTKDSYDRLHMYNGVSVFEILDQKGTVFYRAHNPEKSGDDKSGKPSVQSALSGKSIAGAEFGKSGIAIRAYTPLKKSGQIIGVLQVGIDNDFLQAVSNIIHSDIVIYQDNVMEATTLEEGDELTLMNQHHEKAYTAFQSGKEIYSMRQAGDSAYFMPLYDATGLQVIGMIGCYKHINILSDYINNSLLSGGIILLVTTLIVLAISFVIGSYFANPLSRLTDVSQVLAAGDLTAKVSENDAKRGDEIGRLATSFDQMASSFSHLVGDVKSSSVILLETSEVLGRESESIAHISEEISRTVGELAEGAMNQAEETEQGASQAIGLGEILSHNNELNDDVNRSIHKVREAVDEGRKGLDELVGFTDKNLHASAKVYEIVKTTEENSQSISVASDMIAGIADQTNLLALNAAIEAARAGEAGRGFAVVAEEIRKLAEESTKSTQTINEVVEKLIENASYAVTKMEEMERIAEQQKGSAGETEEKFKQILDAIIQAETSVVQVINSSGEIEKKKADIIQILESLAAIAEENAASTEEVSASTQEQSSQIQSVYHEAETLVGLANDLEDKVSIFKI